MQKNKFKIILTAIVAFLSGALAVGASFAWFTKASIINTASDTGIKGKVLTGYFHSGDGTEEKPYTITTAWHYENFIKLHYEAPDFAGEANYFQFGSNDERMPEGTDKPMFYAVDPETGIVDTSNTSDTLDLKGRVLPPLGTEEKPFIGHVDGSGLTVKNFTIGGEHYYDIGIFGFVDVDPKIDFNIQEVSPSIRNVYFTDFSIDTKAASDLLEHKETDIMKRPHYIEGEDNKASVGYIAGHITYSALCDDVYANNCTINKDGDNDNSELVDGENYVDVQDSYGYFGKTEFDNGAGKGSVGSNYSFTFDSEAVYRYMSRNYQNIRNNPLRTRNTEYVDDHPPIDQEINGRTTVNPFSNGTAYVTSGMNSYNLIGDDPDNYSRAAHSHDSQGRSYEGYNHSLSTLGYLPITEEGSSHIYDLMYKTDDGEMVPVPAEKEADLYTGGDRDFDTVKNSEFVEKDYLYYNNSAKKWQYFHIANSRDEEYREVTFNLTNVSSYTITGRAALGDRPNTSNFQAHFYVDGEDVYSFTDGISATLRTAAAWTRYNVTLSVTGTHQVKVPLQLGIHHIAYVISFNTTSNQVPTTWVYYGGSCNLSGGNLHVTQSNFDMNQDLDISSPITINASGHGDVNGLYDSASTFTCDEETTFNPETDLRPYHNVAKEITAKDLYGQDGNNDPESLTLEPEFMRFEYVDYQKEQIDPTSGEPVIDEEGHVVYNTYHKWQGIYDAPKSIKTHTIVDADGDGVCDSCSQHYSTGETSHADAPIYIADDPILTESGYSAENIDVVGGGFQFSQNYVTIDGEDNRNLTFKLTESDIGKKFYATEHGANSIVLYLSNVGGLNATDKMGDIKFHYTWTLSSLFPVPVDFKSMVFKKGGTQAQGGYVLMNNNLAMEDGDYADRSNDDTGLNRTIEMVLRRGIVKKCAYAALDKDGNILCGYDANGNQIGYTGTIDERTIATYVLLVGVKNNIQTPFVRINTRITRIEFEYVAPSGFGGDFGSVEFRSANQTVDSTIFNFYFLVSKDDKYRITVSYSGSGTPSGTNKGRYDLTVLYNSNSSASLKVLFYLYDIGSYEVYCNGERVAENGNGELEIESTNPSSWPPLVLSTNDNS